jgi:hypothetical protein
MAMADDALLRRAAERASRHPFYLASSLLAYARAERLDDAGLADRIGCDLASLPALLLCRRPTGEPPMFRVDVEAIADRFGLNATHLACILRRADTLVAIADAPAGQPGGLLAAARDRETDDHHQAGAPVDRSGPEPDEDDA